MIWQDGVLLALLFVFLIVCGYAVVKYVSNAFVEDEPKIKRKHKVITLCGSTRFKEAYLYFTRHLTLNEDAVIISVSCFHHADNLNISNADKAKLDDIHIQKIEMADEIFIVDPGGYIGEHTKSEIAHAMYHDMEIRYASEEFPEVVKEWEYIAKQAFKERDNAKVNTAN